MNLPESAPVAMVLGSCHRCGQQYPRPDAGADGGAFCEPCRDAQWRDERGLGQVDAAVR